MRIKFIMAFIAITFFAVGNAQLRRPPLVEKSVELPGNFSLKYVEQGDPAGTPVIMLHGFTDSWYSYTMVLPFMPPSVHVYAVSMKGHGNSDRVASGYSPAEMADDVAAFMKTLHIKKAVVVGHSMGSVVAQSFGIQYPEMTNALVLISSLVNFQNNAQFVEFSKTVTNLKDPIDREFAADFQRETSVKPVPQWFFKAAVDESMKVHASVWHEVVKGLLKTDNTWKLDGIKRPVLVIWGDKDTFCPRQDQDILTTLIRRSSLLVYKETGHNLHWEEPRRFADDLLSFLNRIGLRE